MVLEKIEDKAKEKEKEREADVYEIGRRFLFWESQRKNKDFVKAKYQNVREEIFESPLLSGLITKKMWDGLSQKVEIKLQTQMAKRVKSNGLVCHMSLKYTNGFSVECFDVYSPSTCTNWRKERLSTNRISER